jgi:CubicO group peptidase (beta-lactamase class C family)
MKFYICKTQKLIPLYLKYTLFFSLMLFAFTGCKQLSEKKETKEDSLLFYPSTPKNLDKSEFRYYYNAIESFYESYLNRNGFSGAMLVAKNGSVIFEKYTGFTDAQRSDTLKSTSSLHIASTSKPFAAMAVLQLSKNGKLSVDDPVNKYLETFPYPEISIKMLMNHRSGLANYLYFIDPKKVESNEKLSNQDVLNYMAEHSIPLNYRPDTRYNYCNTNFVLLALIIEKVSGKTFPDFMKQHFFMPLGMEHSFVFTAGDSLTYTKSFYPNWRPWAFDLFDGTYGDKNIYTTARDLLKWSDALNNNKTFSQALLDSAFKPYSLEKPSQHNYGLGWRLLHLANGKKIIYHHGLWHGSNSFFAMLPDEQVTIIIMGNKLNRNIYKGNLLYDVFGNYSQKRNDSLNPDESMYFKSRK